jgi:hypothetical protein
MSITIDYFFNSDNDVDELRLEINGWLGCDLKAVEDERDYFCTRFMALYFSFGTHSLVNDRQLDFENYKYEIGVYTSVPDGCVREIRTGLMAMIVFILYHRLGIKKGMLVYDVQRLLGRYEERITEHNTSYLFDTVSQKFVNFPQHILDVNALDR